MVLSFGTATNTKPRKLKLHSTCCCKSVYDNGRLAVSISPPVLLLTKQNLLRLYCPGGEMSSSGPINMSILISKYLKETISNSSQRKVTKMKKDVFTNLTIIFLNKCEYRVMFQHLHHLWMQKNYLSQGLNVGTEDFRSLMLSSWVFLATVNWGIFNSVCASIVFWT